MIINLPTKSAFQRQQSKNILSVLPTIWRRKPAGIDMERNYVIVTLCIDICLCMNPIVLLSGYFS